MNIYIGNIPPEASIEQIKELFHPFGKIHFAQIIMNLYSRQSQGFGFVEMVNEEEGEKAIAALNGINFMSHFLEVKHVRDRPA